MFMIFLDESGYAHDWKQGIKDQPFYVLSAVCLPADNLPAAYGKLRKKIAKLKLPDQKQPLGRGYEIKARSIAKAAGWFKDHEPERNAVRDAMLSFPREAGGVAFVAAFDKAAHKKQYVVPESPYLLATKFVFERVQWYLQQENDHGYCIFDQNSRLEESRQTQATELLREGSTITYLSSHYGEEITYTFEITRIVDAAFAQSHCSLGLQVADFFATLTYMYFRDGRPTPCGWWDVLRASLHRKDGTVKGSGLKVFP